MLTLQIGSQSCLDESSFLDTTGVSEGSMTFGEIGGSLDRERASNAPKRDWERTVSMDLLAGRPDKDKTIVSCNNFCIRLAGHAMNNL